MFARALRTIRDGLLSLAYPQECRLCGGAVTSFDYGVACLECWEDASTTRLFSGLPICAKCGAPFGDMPPAPAAAERLCGDCRGLPFEIARSIGAYSGALEASILFLKSEPHLCPRLCHLLAQTYQLNRDVLESDLVMAVPLHRSRERQRGFNQSAIIARMLASRFDLVYDRSALTRIRNTDRHRAGTDSPDRARSVERAFKVTDPRKVRGVSILLIDDLFTTGSTLSAATAALTDAGAASVRALTVARAVRAGLS